MSLLDRLRDAQDEPARHRASPYAGPSILTVGQLRAMERALAREGFFDRDRSVPDVVDAGPVIDEPVGALVPVPRYVAVATVIEPLPVWSPPAAIAAPVKALGPAPAVEPLPIWTPPALEPATPPSPTAFDPCPNCGEEVAIDRIDLTIDASWVTCRACGLRWGHHASGGTGVPTPIGLLATD